MADKKKKKVDDDWLEAEMAKLVGAPKEKSKPKKTSEADQWMQEQEAAFGLRAPAAARSGGAEPVGKQKRSTKSKEDEMFEMMLTDKQKQQSQAAATAEAEFRRQREEEERAKAAAAAEKERNRQRALAELERRKAAEEEEKKRQAEQAQRYFAEQQKLEAAAAAPPPPPPKPAHAPKPAAKDEEHGSGGDDYDEDFEDYDDDFEEDAAEEAEEEPPVSAPPAPKPPPMLRADPPSTHAASPSPGAGVAGKPPQPPSAAEARRMSELQKSLEAENQAARMYARSPANEAALNSRPGTASSGNAGIAERQRSPVVSSAYSGGGFSTVSSSNQPSASASLPDRKFNDIAAAKQRAQAGAAAAKHRRRWEELTKLGVALVEQAFDILTLQPLTPYEFYARGYGRVNSSPMYCQTGDDNAAVECQTEEPDREAVACQWPEDAGLVDRSAMEASAAAEAPPPLAPRASPTPGEAPAPPPAPPTAAQSRTAAAVAERLRIVKSDPSRLSRFLQRASLVMESLLEENLAHRPAPPAPPAPSGSALSAARHAFSSPRLLAGRPLRGLAFAPGSGGWVLAAYGRSGDRSAAVCPDQGVLCLWGMQDARSPAKVLILEGEPTCCALDGPAGGATFAFAGTEEGSVSLWDLREPASAHRVADLDGKGGTAALRTPSYCTDGLHSENHPNAICRVVAFGQGTAEPAAAAAAAAAAASAPSASSGAAVLDPAGSVAGTAAMQLASVDRSGGVSVWLVVEMRAADPTACEADFGLGFGSRVKLLRSSRAELDARKAAQRVLGLDQAAARALAAGLAASDAAFHPDDPSLYVLASSLPAPLHCARFGEPPPPRAYEPPAGLGPAAAPSALAFSPFFAPYFLAGFSTGLVSLYRSGEAAPVRSWPASDAPITAVAWSPSRPAVFFALDSFSTLTAYDLLKSERDPVFREQLAREGGPVSAIAASRERAAGARPSLAVGFLSGLLEVHVLSAAVARGPEGEEAQARRLFDSVL